MQDVEERMQALGSSDVCALFLLSVESREAGKAINLENGAERAASFAFALFPYHGYRRLFGRKSLRRVPHRTSHQQRRLGEGDHAQRGAVVRHGADASGDD